MANRRLSETVILSRRSGRRISCKVQVLNAGILAFSQPVGPKSLVSAIKPDASREVLPPKSGVRMTGVESIAFAPMMNRLLALSQFDTPPLSQLQSSAFRKRYLRD